MPARDRDRACGNRVRNEARAIGPCARKRKEKIARPYGTAVRGKARDLDRAGICRRNDRGVFAEEVGKLHRVPGQSAPGLYDRHALPGMFLRVRLTALSSMPQE